MLKIFGTRIESPKLGTYYLVIESLAEWMEYVVNHPSEFSEEQLEVATHNLERYKDYINNN